MDEDIVRQKAIMELVVQFDNASTTKDDMRKAYEKYNGIPQESHALIDTFLKQESDKDYKMHLAMYKILIKLFYFLTHTHTMANKPNEVRAAIHRRLRTEQEKELQLVKNLLGEMTRYLLQKLSRAEEETRVRSLPLDEPLNRFSLQTLRMSSDMRISNILEAAREEVIRSMDESQELINNYRAI
ncbi:hypothetical protein Tco_1366616 [Tanacetum coccineum]